MSTQEAPETLEGWYVQHDDLYRQLAAVACGRTDTARCYQRSGHCLEQRASHASPRE